jgi:hypothetical protein
MNASHLVKSTNGCPRLLFGVINMINVINVIKMSLGSVFLVAAAVLAPTSGDAAEWGPWQTLYGDDRIGVDISFKWNTKFDYGNGTYRVFCRLRNRTSGKVDIDADVVVIDQNGVRGNSVVGGKVGAGQIREDPGCSTIAKTLGDVIVKRVTINSVTVFDRARNAGGQTGSSDVIEFKGKDHVAATGAEFRALNLKCGGVPAAPEWTTWYALPDNRENRVWVRFQRELGSRNRLAWQLRNLYLGDVEVELELRLQPPDPRPVTARRLATGKMSERESVTCEQIVDARLRGLNLNAAQK